MNLSSLEEQPDLPPEANRLAEEAIETAKAGEKYARNLAQKASQHHTFRPLSSIRSLRRNRKALLQTMKALNMQDKDRSGKSVFDSTSRLFRAAGNYSTDGNGSIRLTRDSLADLRRSRLLKKFSTARSVTY